MTDSINKPYSLTTLIMIQVRIQFAAFLVVCLVNPVQDQYTLMDSDEHAFLMFASSKSV